MSSTSTNAATRTEQKAKARKRRTPAEAREVILQAAEQRLRRLGVDGLNVVGVASDAGLSHASVIHHFGNTAGMRAALEDRMTEALLRDLVTALEDNAEPKAILAAVFHAMVDGGHAKLLAWRALNESGPETIDHAVADLFEQLVQRSSEVFATQNQNELRNSLLLIASAAIGFGISGQSLPGLFGLQETDIDGFAEWVGAKLLTEHRKDV